MTPEDTIREALERLRKIPARHGGVATFPALAALDTLISERDELRKALITVADWDRRLEAELEPREHADADSSLTDDARRRQW